MADHDFGRTGGATPAFLKPTEDWFKGLVMNYPMAMMIGIVILIILVIAMFFGWIGAASKKEGLKSCMVGNQSALCRQGRDGPGEGLTNADIAQGFGADPVAFCAGAGEPTSDPRDYLLQQARAEPSAAEAAGLESLSPYASPTDRMDQNLMIGMQH